MRPSRSVARDGGGPPADDRPASHRASVFERRLLPSGRLTTASGLRHPSEVAEYLLRLSDARPSPAVSQLEPECPRETDAGKIRAARGEGDKFFVRARNRSRSVITVHAPAVIPVLVTGTHRADCSIIAGVHGCFEFLARKQAEEWVPATRAGMTFVGVVIDASHPPAARQCAHLPRLTARVPDGAAHRACADPGSFPVSVVERPRICRLPASSVRGHSTWEVWRPLDPL